MACYRDSFTFFTSTFVYREAVKGEGKKKGRDEKRREIG
jgi:hypothetical protein